MEFLFEALLQFGGELVVQGLVELLSELGLHSLSRPFRRRHPLWAALGFVLWGLIAGGISLLVLPHSTIRDPTLRLVNLVATPLALGVAMTLLGRLRERKGQALVRLDRFGYAFLFALVIALVRYVGAR